MDIVRRKLMLVTIGAYRGIPTCNPDTSTCTWTVKWVHESFLGYHQAERACLHWGGGPEAGEVTRLGGVTRQSIYFLILIWSRVGRVARSARPGNPLSWGQILPCKLFKVELPASPGSYSWYIKYMQNSLWRWLCIIIKGNNRMPQHKRLQLEQQVSVEEYQMPLKTRGLPAFCLFTSLATIQ